MVGTIAGGDLDVGKLGEDSSYGSSVTTESINIGLDVDVVDTCSVVPLVGLLVLVVVEVEGTWTLSGRIS